MTVRPAVVEFQVEGQGLGWSKLAGKSELQAESHSNPSGTRVCKIAAIRVAGDRSTE